MKNHNSEEITGGDGIPRQRVPGVANGVFLLRPGNLGYLHRPSSKIVVSEDEKEHVKNSLMFGVLIVIYIPVLIIALLMSVVNVISIFFVLMVGILLYSGSSWYKASQKRSRLGNTGTLFIGQITESTGKWAVKNRINFYYVTISYKVRVSKGHVTRGSATAIYMDMVGKPLPEPGTPIAVLYLSDEDKMLL